MIDKTTKPARRVVRQPKTKDDANAPVLATPPKRPSKIEAVIALLERKEGATIADLIEATNWLPHTTRAALTGLKKKGKVITKAKRGDVTCYFIADPAA